ncbi:MAG TPA: hypothetical protein VNI01_13815, partial [Elusimicrobiota bacterium]|nr:hypothetical protein [Elusimicrobiota bacterium]
CSGGKETFARSMAALALLGGLVPVSAASAAFLPGPYSALLPTAYGTYLLVRTVALLHHAPAVQAWIVFGTCGVLAGAGQIRFQQTIAVLQSQLEMMANLYSTNPLAAAQAASQAQGAAAALPGQQNLPPAVPDMAGVQALADQAKSSLDMVAQPGAGAALGNMPTLPAGPDGGPAIPGAGASGAQMQQLGQMSAAMMSALNQQLAANPNAMNAMSPQQRQQMQQLMQMANQMTAQIQQGRMPTAQDRQNIQQALRGMGPAVQPLDGAEIETAPAPRPAAKRRRRRPAPQTQAPAYE